ncbi:AraC family transcriptional regulator [Planobispora takensis]|uniref:AraC family transcriptional regulator n=1 Tax=Planobispora takensis TaxID=1367882 RepID=A0A8J3T3T1_9ACTN|nr:helix-turn-helix domain-containing protein [Planobispora takensis]GII05819.1 AraC family transcriptional regulator [Planobispora takensis]
MQTLHFDSADLELTEEFLSKAYTPMRIGGRAESTRGQVWRHATGSTSIDLLDFDYDMSHNAQPIGKYCLGNVHAGTIVRQYFPEGTQGTFGPGDVFMYAPHDRPYAGVIQGARYNLIMFDPLLLAQVAAAVPGRKPGELRLTGDRPVSAAAARHLRRTIAYLHEQVLADPVICDAPLVASTASQLLAVSVLNTFPNNALSDALPGEQGDGHPDALRRAIAFIDAYAGTDITAVDIATAARVSLRALQYAFRRHLDTTPMGYLRQVRLSCAHADLLAADPTGGATVTAIAARWGFFQTGRFSAAYRAAYGRFPTQTLAQRPL